MKDSTIGLNGDYYDEDPFEDLDSDDISNFNALLDSSGMKPLELKSFLMKYKDGTLDPGSLPRRMLLGEGCSVSLDPRVSGLNSNVLVLGPSGSGKTRGFIEPNLYLHEENVVVLDVKGRLYERLAEGYRRDGYKVHRYDLERLDRSEAYNPLISALNKWDGSVDVDQLWRLAAAFFPTAFTSDPYWVEQARMFFVCAVDRLLQRSWSYGPTPTLSDIPGEIYDLVAGNSDAAPRKRTYVERRDDPRADGVPATDDDAENDGTWSSGLINEDLETLDDILMEVVRKGEGADSAEAEDDLGVTAVATAYDSAVRTVFNSEKTFASIMSVLFNGLAPLLTPDVEYSFLRGDGPGSLKPETFGSGRHACFVRVSDIDHTRAALASVFFSHCIQTLFRLADEAPDGSLPRPVRFVLDDFANLHIDGIADILSTCRSRNIAVTLCLQSVSQLNALYGSSVTNSIVSNCDIQLVLGFADLATAAYFSPRANKEPTELYETPRGLSWLFLRGERGRTVRALDTGATQVVDVAEAMAHDLGSAA